MRNSEIPKSAKAAPQKNGVPKIDSIVNSLTKVGECVVQNALSSPLVMPHALFNRSAEMIFASEKLPELLSAELNEPSEGNRFNFSDLIQVQDRVLFVHSVSQVIESKTEKSIEVRLTTENHISTGARPSWAEINLFTLNDENSNGQVLLATFRDISERKIAQAELVKAKTLAEEVSSAKSQFLANTSHELRTPLNAILGFSDLLMSPLMNNLDDSKRVEYTSLINDSAKHLLSVLNGILDMSKIESGKYEIVSESFDISKCLQNTVAIMRGMSQSASITIDTNGLCDLPEIVADQKAVKQILINLISNAIKFSQEGSSILVRAQRRARSINIYVEDSGIGISPEHLEHLGKPFFQADSKYDRKYEGTGLGLSVVRGLVELHNGSLAFDSGRGMGTTVCVTLPIHGKPGRSIPSSEKTEKITPLFSSDTKTDFKIARNAS